MVIFARGGSELGVQMIPSDRSQLWPQEVTPEMRTMGASILHDFGEVYSEEQLAEAVYRGMLSLSVGVERRIQDCRVGIALRNGGLSPDDSI